MAGEPDPADFVKRVDTGLELLGTPLRFAGADIPWLGLRQEAGGALRRPTAYEVRDALVTVQALGGSVVRSVSLAGTAGCALCLEPSAGHFDDAAFAALDQTIKTAGNLGLRLILPLAGGSCVPGQTTPGSICVYPGWHGSTDPHAFFTEPATRADFLARVRAILEHVNSLTGVAYRDDPAILAWENCDACAGDADPAAVGAWTEAVGQVIKEEDRFHLYENGAFAGRIRPGAAHEVAASAFAPPSVDIVGDTAFPAGDNYAIRKNLSAATDAVGKAGRVYVLDDFDWGQATWKTEDDLQVFLDEMARQRALAGALFGGLQGHADQGGYLPPPPAAPGQAAALYFPGLATQATAKPDMESRARALRRFDYSMADVMLAPAYLLPPKPDIISVRHGHVLWRGAAGALDYTIERSPNPQLPGTWTVVCQECTNDGAGGWQDPEVPPGPAWYRIMPFNINGHKSPPSDPVQSQ
jgi:hypothetical protein